MPVVRQSVQVLAAGKRRSSSAETHLQAEEGRPHRCFRRACYSHGRDRSRSSKSSSPAKSSPFWPSATALTRSEIGLRPGPQNAVGGRGDTRPQHRPAWAPIPRMAIVYPPPMAPVASTQNIAAKKRTSRWRHDESRRGEPFKGGPSFFWRHHDDPSRGPPWSLEFQHPLRADPETEAHPSPPRKTDIVDLFNASIDGNRQPAHHPRCAPAPAFLRHRSQAAATLANMYPGQTPSPGPPADQFERKDVVVFHSGQLAHQRRPGLVTSRWPAVPSAILRP